MADNVTLPGIGEVAGADDIGGVKIQRVKLIHGVDGTNDGDVAATNPLPVVAASGHTTTVTITRPSNATAYTAGDAVGDTGGSAILTFANMGKASGNVIITGAHLQVDVVGIPSGMSTFTLELYNAAPDAIADNAAWDLVSSGDRGKYLGYLTLTTPVDKGSTLYSINDGFAHQVLLASTSLYAVLRTDGAFTPTSAAVKRLTLSTVEV